MSKQKYYTWDEIRAMPLETKFRLAWWATGDHAKFRRTGGGEIALDMGRSIYEISSDKQFLLTFQDRFELYEEPKKEREYVDGTTALSKLMNGEWKKIAFDDEIWISEARFIHLVSGQALSYGRWYFSLCLDVKYYNQKLWFEVK